MSEIYWYISKAKLDLLIDATPAFLQGVSVKLGFKLPFVEGSLSGTQHSALIRDTERVVKRLESKEKFKSYNELDENETPVMIRFEGPAVRHVDEGQFWVASECGEAALLLAGSAAYAIGMPPGGADSRISPSVDPVGAVKAAFENISGISPIQGMSLSARLSYVWQEIMRDSLSSAAALPKVEGLAIFASSMRADRGQMRRVHREHIQRMVVGTPLYIRQI